MPAADEAGTSPRSSDPSPVQPIELDDRGAAELLPRRDPKGHKGTHGTLLVVAGSLDYAGAAHLVTLAAARAGAGLVCLAVPRSLQSLFAARVLEVTTMGLPETGIDGEIDPEPALDALLARDHQALAVGSGLRPGPGTTELVRTLLVAGHRRPGDATGTGSPPAVLDAEALNSLATTPGWWKRVQRRCVLTPHPGEFVRLAGLEREATKALGVDDQRRASAARDAAREWGQTIVLKGARTVIAAPDGRLATAPFENPALATAGTGDVLAGAIAALLAQGLGPYDAACLGVYLHGAAGEEVRSELGEAGLLAGDLPHLLPRVRGRLARLADRGSSRGGFGFTPRSRSP